MRCFQTCSSGHMISQDDLLSKPLEVYVSIVQHNGKPALLIRRLVYDKELIHFLALAAINQLEIPVVIKFYNKSSEIENLRKMRILGLL